MKINMIDYKNQKLELTDIENAKLATHMVSAIEAESAARKAWIEDKDNYLPRLIKGDAVDILNYVDDKDIPEYRKRNLDELRKMANTFNDNSSYYSGYKAMNDKHKDFNFSDMRMVAHYDSLTNDNIVSVFVIKDGEMNRVDFKTCDDKVFFCYEEHGKTYIDRTQVNTAPYYPVNGIGNDIAQAVYCTVLAGKPVPAVEIFSTDTPRFPITA